MAVNIGLFGLLVIITGLGHVAADEFLGNKTVYGCREGQTNLTWHTSRIYQYDFIDVYYRRREEDNTTYKKAVLIDWLPTRVPPWKITANPARFIGRLRTEPPNLNPSQSLSLSFILENTLRIDNGQYDLSANFRGGTVEGTYHLIVYHEGNYFPTLEDSSNTTEPSDANNAYSYTWSKPLDSPSIGVKMLPKTEKKTLDPKQCFFDETGSCQIMFTNDELAVGRVDLSVQYLFPTEFIQCNKLISPPSSLVIDIPRRLTIGSLVGIGLFMVVVAVAVGLITYFVIIKKQTNKSKLSWRERKAFVQKCIDHIQDCSEVKELTGVYRKSTPLSLLKEYIAKYKKEVKKEEIRHSRKEYDVVESETEVKFEEAPKITLASGIKHVLQTSEECWIPVEAQKDISENDDAYCREDGTMDTDRVCNLFKGKSKGHRIRRDIVALIIRHFDWYLTKTDGVDRKECGLVDKEGLAKCISPNFFKSVTVTTDNIDACTNRWQIFLIGLITHFDLVFPLDDDQDNITDKTTSPFLAKNV